MNGDADDSKIINVLCEMRDLLKAGFHNDIRSLLEDTLDTDKKRLAYQSTNGQLGAKDIGKLLSISDNTVRQMWDTSIRRGLIMALPAGKRRRIFDLADYGLLPEKAVPVGVKVPNAKDEGNPNG